MAIPTPVNGQITDSVTQTGVQVLGDAPAVAMSSVFQSLAHSTSILSQNAVQAQKQAAIASQAATKQGIIQLYSVNTMSAAQATSKVAKSDTSDVMLTMLIALAALKG